MTVSRMMIWKSNLIHSDYHIPYTYSFIYSLLFRNLHKSELDCHSPTLKKLKQSEADIDRKVSIDRNLPFLDVDSFRKSYQFFPLKKAVSRSSRH